MKFVNLTPHVLNVRGEDGNLVTIPVSGIVARLETLPAEMSVVAGIKIQKSAFGDLLDLPGKQDGVLFVGSMAVAQAAAKIGRADVVSPGMLIRDATGQPVGCDGLTAW